MKRCWTIAFLGFTHILSTILTAQAVDEREQQCDLLIVGGTESGWAAAVQAARMNVPSIILVNDIDWLGGQYTAEAVCAIDENRGINHKVPFPRSGLFAELTERFEAFNLEKYGHEQPGNAWTARTTIRPAEAEAIFRKMLKPYLDSGQITLIENHVPEKAIQGTTRNRLAGMVFRNLKDENALRLRIRAPLTIDASDWGDAIKLAGADYEFGVDYQPKYNEPNAPSDRELYSKTDMNPITWCMVIEETDEEAVIDRLFRYDDRNYFLTTDVTKKDYNQLGWKHKPHRPFNPPWMPSTGKFYSGDRTVYSQRRLVDSYGLELKDPQQKDVILLNWSVQDYPLDRLPAWVNEALEHTQRGASRKNIVEMTAEQREIIFSYARRHSLGLLYHLQTTVHDRMEDKSHSFRRFKLSDEFGTDDHLPLKPYIRESLRLRAMYMMREQDVRNFNRRDQYAAQMYYDGVACWQFPFDFHPTGREFLNNDGKNPWEIYIKPKRTWNTDSDRALFPLRSLIPIRVDGLLGAQKNLGYSSIVSSAVRLHDQCVHIGQAAGSLAAVCHHNDVDARMVPYQRTLLQDVRTGLCDPNIGTPVMLWPFRDLEPQHPSFVAANLLAVGGLLPLSREEVDFRPDEPAATEWIQEIANRTRTVKILRDQFEVAKLSKEITRGEFVNLWWDAIRTLRDQPLLRKSSRDYDEDGIQNEDDPQPFDPENKSLPVSPALKLPPQEDGIPGEVKPATADWSKQFNFTGLESDDVDGYINDFGEVFNTNAGFGWDRDLTESHRRRNAIEGDARDTFLFTREYAFWEIVVPRGVYQVTVCVGDSGHPQQDQRVTVEEKVLVDDVSTLTGRFHEATAKIAVVDGLLTIELGKKGRTANTCLNWIQVVRLKE